MRIPLVTPLFKALKSPSNKSDTPFKRVARIVLHYSIFIACGFAFATNLGKHTERFNESKVVVDKLNVFSNRAITEFKDANMFFEKRFGIKIFIRTHEKNLPKIKKDNAAIYIHFSPGNNLARIDVPQHLATLVGEEKTKELETEYLAPLQGRLGAKEAIADVLHIYWLALEKEESQKNLRP